MDTPLFNQSNVKFLDIKKNGSWLLKSGDEYLGTENSGGLFNLLQGLLRNSHCYINRDFQSLTNIFNDYGLIKDKDYKIVLHPNGYHLGVTLTNDYGKKIYFRFYENYFYEKLNGDLKTNVDKMEYDINWLEKKSGMKRIYQYYSLEEMMKKDWKIKIDWDKNFKGQITKKEYKKLENWKQGAFNYLKPEYKNKILKIDKWDKNSFYQSIWEKNDCIPTGKPYYNHKLLGEKQSERCNHNLVLLKFRMTAKIKPNGIPILKQMDKNAPISDTGRDILECDRQIFYKSLNALEEISRNYDIYDLWILEQICFDNYEGDGFKEFNDLWISIKNESDSKPFKNNLKININKILGIQAPKFLETFKRLFVDGFDKDGEIITREKEVNKDREVPYIPLYLFVTDGSRNEMYQICNEFKNELVMCNTDAVALISNPKTYEKFCKLYKVSPNEVGAFKQEDEGEYYYFKAIGSYISAKSVENQGDISEYKHTGVSNNKAIDVNNKSLKEVVDIIEREKNEL